MGIQAGRVKCPWPVRCGRRALRRRKLGQQRTPSREGATCPPFIGDGTDDQQAATQLGLSPHTVGTHRKSIMAKLKLHHKGQLMLYAIQHGYIRVTAQRVFRPGFQRRLADVRSDSKS